MFMYAAVSAASCASSLCAALSCAAAVYDESAADAGAGAVSAVRSPASAQLIVFGCAKLFEQPFLQFGQNPMLLLNCVDALALEGDMIGRWVAKYLNQLQGGPTVQGLTQDKLREEGF